MKFVFLFVIFVMPFSLLRAEAVSTTTKVWDDGSYLNPDGPESGEVMPGCSWYCGEAFPTVTASSQLKGESYVPKKAHDFDFKTAWVEGVEGMGKGEFVEYRFKLPATPKRPDNFGINELVIINGYRKNDQIWKANGRVKSLKMSVNGVPTRIFELADTKHPQSAAFPFVPIKAGEEVILRFEILDAYPGEKYQDTAISELLFDGTGVH